MYFKCTFAWLEVVILNCVFVMFISQFQSYISAFEQVVLDDFLEH